MMCDRAINVHGLSITRLKSILIFFKFISMAFIKAFFFSSKKFL